MSFYVITKKDESELDSAVFSSDDGETIAVFTDPTNAQQYIDDAGWGDKQTVAHLEPVAFLEWLLACHHGGVKSMMTDPNRGEQERDEKVCTMDIEAQLKHAGQHLLLVANCDF